MLRRRFAFTLLALAALVWLSVAAAQPGRRVYLPALADPRPTGFGTPPPTRTLPPTVTRTATATATMTATPDPLDALFPNGGFEQGGASWTLAGDAVIVPPPAPPIPPRTGARAALVRVDPSSDGAFGPLLHDNVTVPSAPSDLVLYYQFQTTETPCDTAAIDASEIRVELFVAGTFPEFEIPVCAPNNTTSWQRFTVDLSPYAGESLSVLLRANLYTQGSWVMFDDVRIIPR